MPSLKDYLEQVSTLYRELPDDKKQEIAEKISSDPNLVHQLLSQTSEVYNKLPLEKKQKIVAEFSNVPWYKKAWRAFAAGSGEILNDVGVLLNKIGDVVEKGGVSTLPIYGVSGKDYKSAAKQAKQIAKDTKRYWLPENKPTSEAYKIPIATQVIESVPEMLIFAPTMEAGEAIGAAAKLPKIAQYVTSGLGYSLPKLGLGSYSKEDVATQAVLDTALGVAGTIAGKVVGKLFSKTPVSEEVKQKITEDLSKEITKNPPKTVEEVEKKAKQLAEKNGVKADVKLEEEHREELQKDIEKWQEFVKQVTQKVREKQPPKVLEDEIDDISDIRPEPTPVEKVKEQIEGILKKQKSATGSLESIKPAKDIPDGKKKLTELPKRSEAYKAAEQVAEKQVLTGNSDVVEFFIKELKSIKDDFAGHPATDKQLRYLVKLLNERGINVDVDKVKRIGLSKQIVSKLIDGLKDVRRNAQPEATLYSLLNTYNPPPELVVFFTKEPTKDKYLLAKEILKHRGLLTKDDLFALTNGEINEKLKNLIAGNVNLPKFWTEKDILKRGIIPPEISAKFKDIPINLKLMENYKKGNDIFQVWKGKIGNADVEINREIVNGKESFAEIVRNPSSKLAKLLEKIGFEKSGDDWLRESQIPLVEKVIPEGNKYLPHKQPKVDLLTDEDRQLLFGGLHPKEVVKSVQATRKKIYETLAPINPKLAEKFYSPELKNEPKDINFVQQYLYNPEMLARYRGDKYPQVRRIYNAFVEQDHKNNKWLYQVNRLIDRVDALTTEDKDKLFKALYRESHTGKQVDPNTLPEHLRPIYKAIRFKLKQIWSDYRNTFRKDLEEHIRGLRVSKEKKAALLKALNTGKIDEIKDEFPALAKKIEELHSLYGVPFYMPQKRTGKWLVTVRSADGDFKFTADFDTKTEALQFYKEAQKDPFEAIKKWHDELGIPMPTKADTELEVLEPVPATQPLHEWREDIPLEKTRALLVNLAKNKGDKAQAYEALLEDLTNWFKSMGWSAHTIKRKNVPGFQLNPDVAFQRLKAYLVGYGLAKNKKEAAKEALDAFYELATSKGAPERLTTWLRDYIDYVLGTPEKAGAKIGRAVSTYYLWGKPLTVMVNSLQNILTGVPEYIYRGIDPRRLATAYAKIFGKKKLRWDEKKAIVRALEEGEINPKVLDEMLSNWGAKSSKILNAIRKGQYGELLKNKDALKEIVDLGMLPFTLVESYWNRLPFFLGAFSHYRAKGLSFDEAYKKAVEALHGAHYYAGRPNRWKFQRGDAGRILTALQTFTYHYLDQLTKYMGYSIKGDKQAQKALAAMLVSMLALGGISGVGGDALYEYVIKPAYRRLTGQDLDWVLSHSKYGDFIKYGLLAPISPSIGRSIGVGIEADPERAIGGPVQGILRQLQRAKKLYDMGDTTGAVIQLLPPGLRNPVKAYLASKRGITSYRGTPLRDLTTGKFVKPETPYEKVLYAMGIMPRRIERIYDKIGAIKQAQEEKNKALQKITHLYMIGRKDDAKKLYLNWNKHCYEMYKKAKTPEQKAYWRALIISPVSVRRAIRGSMRGLVGISKGFLGI